MRPETSCSVGRFGAFACAAAGQDLEPRTYANTPVGLNFVIADYWHTEGGVATDPALPIENTQVELHSGVLAYARAIDVYGKSAKFDVVLPYASLVDTAKVAVQNRDPEISGMTDSKFHFSMNFFGAPALSLKQFANYEQDTIFGTNLFELASGVRLYTDNENFFGDKHRSQAPIYSVQGHLIFNLGYGIWAAADATFYTGGQTRVDGRQNDDKLENSRAGATLALPVNRSNSVKLYYSTSISGRRGSDFDLTGIALQCRFGGGL